MAKRRAHGEGAVYKRKDGRWVGEILLPNGRRKFIYGRTRKAAAERLFELRQTIAAGGPVEPDATPFAVYAERWLDNQRPSLKPRTIESYAYALGLVRERLGNVALSKLDPMTAESAIAELDTGRKRELSYSVLHRALAAAVEKGLIVANPMQRVARPKYRAPEARALNPEECRRLFDAVRGHRLEALFWLAATAGLRYGELGGLQRRDVGKGTVAVRRAISETSGEVRVTEPKSKMSRRTVSLSPKCAQMLAWHLDRTPGLPRAWIFTNSRGGVLRRSPFHSEVWKKVREAAGLNGVRFHDLRHTAATLALAAGADAKTVQTRMGHSSASFTLDVYGHAMVGADRTVADRLDDLIEGR